MDCEDKKPTGCGLKFRRLAAEGDEVGRRMAELEGLRDEVTLLRQQLTELADQVQRLRERV